MKPPVENIRVSAKGREVMIQAKRHTGLKQWNELLRWGFCLSLADPSRPRISRKLDTGMDPVEWATFAGDYSNVLTAAFRARATSDKIDLDDNEALTSYFRAHIERGMVALRSIKSLESMSSLGTGS